MILYRTFRGILPVYRQAGDESLDPYSCNTFFLINPT